MLVLSYDCNMEVFFFFITSWTCTCFILIFLLFSIMYAKYLMTICENVSISLWILERGDLEVLEVFSWCGMYGSPYACSDD